MKIEKLNDNKIRVILNLEDLEDKNVDFHSFMSNPIESQELFSDVLEEAEKELGFITRDYKILLEALATPEGTFILTVTRIMPEINRPLLNKKNLIIKRKQNKLDQSNTIYCFNSFDDFCDFCQVIKNSSLYIDKTINKLIKKVYLYKYNSKYYLICSGININNNLYSLKLFYTYITEFATFINKPSLFESKLNEYGEIVIKNNAITICMKHFSKN